MKILIFQAVFFAYMLLLLRLNPNTKKRKLTLSQVGRLWDKHYRPPEDNWYLHPLSPVGLTLYLAVPLAMSSMLF